MQKVNDLLAKLLSKITGGMSSTVGVAGDLTITLVTKFFDALFGISGTFLSKVSALLGVLHDNLGRVKDLLDRKSDGNGSGGNPPA